MDGAAIFDRLCIAYEADGPSGLAQAMGQPLPTVKGWKQRGSVPLEHVASAALRTGKSLDWIVFGPDRNGIPDFVAYDKAGRVAAIVEAKEMTPPWMSAAAGRPAPAPVGDQGEGGSRDTALIPVGSGDVRPLLMRLPTGPGGADGKEFEIVPRVVRAASAGPGAPAPHQGVDVIDLAGNMAFSYDWLRHNLGHTSGKVASIKVRGDSMSPTLLDGDDIIIDLAARAVDVDGIYVLDLYGRRLIKRVQHLIDGSLVLISDNTAYQREQLPRDKARDVAVLGRMVWPRVR